MDQFLNLLFPILGTLVTALLGFIVTKVTLFLNSKIKDEKTRKLANTLLLIISDSVKAVYQTFVEALKKDGKFTEKAQKEAKQLAVKMVKEQLTPELTNYVKETFADPDSWLNDEIEAILYTLKN